MRGASVPGAAGPAAAPDEGPAGRRHPLAWVPPLAVGAAAAVAAELSVALLLYTAAGFLEALTVILVAELAALGLGLWSAPSDPGPAWEAVRRRWLVALMAFTAAAGVAAGWDLAGGLASRALLRGIGLALLAAFPLYAAGTLLGMVSNLRARDASPAPVAAPAVLGAALGAAATGLLGARLSPVTAYLGCVVLLSAASMVHGRVLDRRLRSRVLDSRASARGELRVEERLRGRRRSLVVLEGDVLRAGLDDTGAPFRAWEAAAAGLLADGAAPGSILVVGAGAAWLPTLLPPGGHATVAEPDPELADLVAEHLARDGTSGVAVPCDLVEGALPRGTWEAAVVDATAWVGREPVPRLPRRTLEALAERLADGGSLVLGGVRLVAGAPATPGLGALARDAAAVGLAWSAAFARPGHASDGIVVLRRASAGAGGGGPPPEAEAGGHAAPEPPPGAAAPAAPSAAAAAPDPPSGWTRVEGAP